MILMADARALPLKDESVQCCVTSPPYWGLRDYGTARWEGGDDECDHMAGPLCSDKSGLAGYTSENIKLRTFGVPFKARCGKCGAERFDAQLGLEATPDEYVANMVAVFREVRRVLKKDGVLWLNLGDSYAGNRSYQVPDSKHRDVGNARGMTVSRRRDDAPCPRSDVLVAGCKPKDLVGIPWRVAFALQADGWYLRSDIIWAKPNPMPESITDRCTKAHEYIFMLSKSSRYYYNHKAIMDPATPCVVDYTGDQKNNTVDPILQATRMKGRVVETGEWKNKRTVWEIATQPYPESHFATFPEEIPRLCILAGSRPGNVILDPFGGSGTTAKVALELGRKPVHIDLTYHELAKKRCTTTPAMAELMI
jgi:site-specific DNA-methyltransferase (cytosine-N4-specific)